MLNRLFHGHDFDATFAELAVLSKNLGIVCNEERESGGNSIAKVVDIDQFIVPPLVSIGIDASWVEYLHQPFTQNAIIFGCESAPSQIKGACRLNTVHATSGQEIEALHVSLLPYGLPILNLVR